MYNVMAIPRSYIMFVTLIALTGFCDTLVLLATLSLLATFATGMISAQSYAERHEVLTRCSVLLVGVVITLIIARLLFGLV